MEIHNSLAKSVVDAAYRVHFKLGPGLLESVYEKVLIHELKNRGMTIEVQKSVPIQYDNLVFDEGFRADLIVDNKLIVELKSEERILPIHKKQLLTYLRLTGMRLGLLINFNDVKIKDGITRIVNGL